MALEEKYDVSINEWINEKDAPLHYWCIADAPADLRLQKIEASLTGGRDYLVNELDHNENSELNKGTPLHCALDSCSSRLQDNRAIIDLLIKYGADPAIKDAKGRSAIDLCSSKAHEVPESMSSLWKEILSQLEALNRRYATDRNDYGVPLHHTLYVDQPIGFRWPIFKAAVDAGYDVNEMDKEPGWERNMGTPLHCAVTDKSARPYEHMEIVKLLLARGADPRIKDKPGKYTPIEDVQISIRIAKFYGQDCSCFEKYLELMEDAARKLSKKEAQEKPGLLDSFKWFFWLVTNRVINRDRSMMAREKLEVLQ